MDMSVNIKKCRVDCGLTQEELAEMLGLQKSAIAKYENGRVTNIKRPIIKRMAEIFNVKPSDLMGIDDEVVEDISKERKESIESIAYNDSRILENQKRFRNEIGEVYFYDDEVDKIVDYAKFIIHSRKK